MLASLNFSKPGIFKLFQQHRIPPRSDSAAFLIWFLENYYRLETVEAVQCVCDQGGDKGTDGIFVNDNEQTVTIFQARIFDDQNKTVGENDLSKFAGAVNQFETAEKVSNLIKTAGDAQVATIARNFDVVAKIGDGYELHAVFLCNALIHHNGNNYLKGEARIEFMGRDELKRRYISSSREAPIQTSVALDIRGHTPTKYRAGDIRMMVVPIKATELVKLSGIENQSLFHYNVRAPLGKTAVNKAIVASIKKPETHQLFPLFHNGVTIIANSFHHRSGKIRIKDYYVVNGCQSLTALYDNKSRLTADLRILTKFIQIEPDSEVAARITAVSNNQNGVSARDFKSNNPVQVRLQNEIRQEYGGYYFYGIKRGEQAPDGVVVIQNQDAGLMLTAFDLREPWNTHRRYQVFEDRHGQVFGNKLVTADRIVLCQAIGEVIEEFTPKIEVRLFAQYLITKYFLTYVIRRILEKDELWEKINTVPAEFVRDPGDRQHFRQCLGTILGDLVVDLNSELNPLGQDFDYRDKLRQEKWVTDLASTLVKERDKQIIKRRTPKFADEWEHYRLQ